MARFSICSTIATFLHNIIHKTKHFGDEAGVLLLCLFFVNSNAMHVKIFYMIVKCVAIATPSIYIASVSLLTNSMPTNVTIPNRTQYDTFLCVRKRIRGTLSSNRVKRVPAIIVFFSNAIFAANSLLLTSFYLSQNCIVLFMLMGNKNVNKR